MAGEGGKGSTRRDQARGEERAEEGKQRKEAGREGQGEAEGQEEDRAVRKSKQPCGVQWSLQPASLQPTAGACLSPACLPCE